MIVLFIYLSVKEKHVNPIVASLWLGKNEFPLRSYEMLSVFS